VHESDDHATASHAERVTEGKSTTLRVELRLGYAKFLDSVGCLRGECLVDLKNVDVVNAEAAVLKSGGDGVGGADSHNLGRDTSHSEADNTAVNFAAIADGNISTCQEDAGCAIGHLGRVTSGGGSALLESGLQLGKTSQGSGGSNTIVPVDHDFGLISVLVLHDGLVNGNLCLEKASSIGSGGFRVTLNSELVLLGAGDTELSSDIFGGNSHRHEAVVGGLAFKDSLSEKVRVNLVRHDSVAH